MTMNEIEREIRKCLYVDNQLENVPLELWEEYVAAIKKEVGKSPAKYTPAEEKEYMRRYKYLDEACRMLNKRDVSFGQ